MQVVPLTSIIDRLYPSEQVDLVRSTYRYVTTKIGDLVDEVVVVGGLVSSLLIDRARCRWVRPRKSAPWTPTSASSWRSLTRGGTVRSPGKTEVRIYDYVDHAVPMLMKMFEKRLRGYRAIGYARGEAPLGLREALDEVVVEHDEHVLRDLEEKEP